MAHLGSFGVARDTAAPDDFEYFGVVIRTNPAATDLALTDFMEHAGAVDEKDPGVITIVKDFMRDLIHPDDFDKFWGLARRNGQTTEDLLAVQKAVVSAVVGRPTGRPSGSSGGRRRTPAKSRAGSSSRVINRLAGRPDLQLAVVAAQEARSG